MQPSRQSCYHITLQRRTTRAGICTAWSTRATHTHARTQKHIPGAAKHIPGVAWLASGVPFSAALKGSWKHDRELGARLRVWGHVTIETTHGRLEQDAKRKKRKGRGKEQEQEQEQERETMQSQAHSMISHAMLWLKSCRHQGQAVLGSPKA